MPSFTYLKMSFFCYYKNAQNVTVSHSKILFFCYNKNAQKVFISLLNYLLPAPIKICRNITYRTRSIGWWDQQFDTNHNQRYPHRPCLLSMLLWRQAQVSMVRLFYESLLDLWCQHGGTQKTFPQNVPQQSKGQVGYGSKPCPYWDACSWVVYRGLNSSGLWIEVRDPPHVRGLPASSSQSPTSKILS